MRRPELMGRFSFTVQFCDAFLQTQIALDAVFIAVPRASQQRPIYRSVPDRSGRSNTGSKQRSGQNLERWKPVLEKAIFTPV